MAASIAKGKVNVCSSVFCSNRFTALFMLQRYSNSQSSHDCGEVSETNMVRLKPRLLRKLRGMQPMPVKRDHRNVVSRNFTKAEFDRKLYARFGAASGVDPSVSWPDADKIEREMAKLSFQKPLEERINEIEQQKEAEAAELARHQQHICDRMAKMDNYMRQYENRKVKRLEQDKKQLERRKAMLEEAREFFGYEVHHHDLKFQQMVMWKEEQEKRMKRQAKKKRKDDYFAEKVAKITKQLTDSAASSNKTDTKT